MRHLLFISDGSMNACEFICCCDHSDHHSGRFQIRDPRKRQTKRKRRRKKKKIRATFVCPNNICSVATSWQLRVKRWNIFLKDNWRFETANVLQKVNRSVSAKHRLLLLANNAQCSETGSKTTAHFLLTSIEKEKPGIKHDISSPSQSVTWRSYLYLDFT